MPIIPFMIPGAEVAATWTCDGDGERFAGCCLKRALPAARRKADGVACEPKPVSPGRHMSLWRTRWNCFSGISSQLPKTRRHIVSDAGLGASANFGGHHFAA